MQPSKEERYICPMCGKAYISLDGAKACIKRDKKDEAEYQKHRKEEEAREAEQKRIKDLQALPGQVESLGQLPEVIAKAVKELYGIDLVLIKYPDRFQADAYWSTKDSGPAFVGMWSWSMNKSPEKGDIFWDSQIIQRFGFHVGSGGGTHTSLAYQGYIPLNSVPKIEAQYNEYLELSKVWRELQTEIRKSNEAVSDAIDEYWTNDEKAQNFESNISGLHAQIRDIEKEIKAVEKDKIEYFRYVQNLVEASRHELYKMKDIPFDSIHYQKLKEVFK